MYVAGLITEPLQSEGGDRHASPEFFRGVQTILKKVSILFFSPLRGLVTARITVQLLLLLRSKLF